MQPTVTSEDLQFQSILDTVFSPQNPDATQCSSSNQHSIVLDKSLESVPAVSLDTLFFLSNAVSDSTSELPITPTSSPHSIILPYTTNEERWQAVLKHDPEANGHFVYSVKSTGIFCRPTCPSRRPLLSNVSFFLTNDEAEKAGFRPCKRCKPHDLVLPSDLRQLSAVELVKKEIEVATAQGVKQPSLRYLANKAGMSSFHFHRVFKARTGVTLDEYRKLVLAQREESTEYYA
ncbi:metal binding domain of Ada-domain-containing protein [Umbelopsis sp. PMI_123]|nr:metal binding domain of Ada-domain-containing protein [Umbelopsis sp. PMI_123]